MDDLRSERRYSHYFTRFNWSWQRFWKGNLLSHTNKTYQKVMVSI